MSGGTLRPFGVMAHVGRGGKNQRFDPRQWRDHGQAGGGQTTHPDTAVTAAPVARGMMAHCLGMRSMPTSMGGTFMVQVPSHRRVGRAAAVPGAAQHAHPRHRSRREGEKTQQQKKISSEARGHELTEQVSCLQSTAAIGLCAISPKNVGLSFPIRVPCATSCCRSPRARESIVPDPCPLHAVHSQTVGAGDKDANRFALPFQISLKDPAPRLTRPHPSRRQGLTLARRA